MQPSITHIALHVPDLDACVEFYQTFCGLRVVHERPAKGSRIVWMAHAGDDVRFVIVIMPQGPRHVRQPNDYAHIGFALDSREAVDAMADRARIAGCLLWPQRDDGHPAGYYCGVLDPAGNAVEFSYGQPLGPGFMGWPGD